MKRIHKMPAGTYTYTLYTITGSGNGTFTVTGSFTVTVYDSDDNFGVGDDQIDNNSTSETGAAPVIQSLGAGAPAGWNVGDTFYYGGSRGIEAGSPTDDFLIPKVDGAWQTTTALYSLPGASVPLVVGQTYSRDGAAGNVHQEVLPCFVSGTHILTPQGETTVENLSVGDLVNTMDHGLQPILWIGCSTRVAKGAMAPILFQKGAIGNSRDLLVSPQHRMLVRDWQAELLFGENEVLVPAKALINDQTVRRKTGGMVCYYHILFDSHEIVFSEGIPSESFKANDKNISGFDADCRDEILELFPELGLPNFCAHNRDARMSLKTKEAQLLTKMMC
ncbi:MAG TPA: type I secretion protein [Rhodobacteraceae bacterium]|nr:type I secretion protein [Paracoccaceae bacterium]